MAIKHSSKILSQNPHLNKNDTHKNANCLYYMSKPNSVRINCVIRGLLSREFCTIDCKFKNIK